MADSCFKLLTELLANPLTYKHDFGVQDQLQKKITQDNRRLDVTKATYAQRLKEHQQLQSEVKDNQHNLLKLKKELNDVTNGVDQAKNCCNLSDSKPPDSEEIRTEIRMQKEKLQQLREITGTRFAYNAQEDVVSGFVGLKGVTPKETVLLPFEHKKTSTSIRDDIWTKMAEASEDCRLNGSTQDIMEISQLSI